MALLGQGRFFLPRRSLSLLLLALAFCLAFLAPARADDASAGSREYEIKAAFLLNFVQFVKWPRSAFSSPSAPFCIGILGDDPFGSALDDTIRGESIDGHPLTVQRSSRLEDLDACQMIFVCPSQEGQAAEILARLKSRPVLTVSDLEDFARQGGDIDFYRAGDKVRFEINPLAARESGLQISSQMLALARIVAP